MARSRVEKKDEAPSYFNIPHKGQIFFIVLCRLTEPLIFSSIAPYLYYMIKDFGFTKPSHIAELSTVVMTSFALGQTITAVYWGKFSDKYGRKPALIVGSFGTLVTTILFGLSTNVYFAVASRFLCGLLNGNVGVMRTMVAEIIGSRKEHQTRVFALLPMAMNVGTIIGPIIGGLTANPVKQYPSLFGWSTLFAKFPYLLPNLVPVPLSLLSVICIGLFIKETGEKSDHLLMNVDSDPFLKVGDKIKAWFTNSHSYDIVPNDEDDNEGLMTIAEEAESGEEDEGEEADTEVQNFDTDNDYYNTAESRRIKNILKIKPVRITLICHVVLMLHIPTFMQLLPIFLATPPIEQKTRNWLIFNGGLGLHTATIGVIVSILAVFSIIIQIGLYPAIATKLGNAVVHRVGLLAFPLCYTAIPYLSFLPTDPKYIAISGSTLLSAFYIIGRTFAVPPMTVLITNATPSRKIMGTIHGLAHSATSAARCGGPFILGNLYSLGVKVGVIGLAWWIMTLVVIIEICVSTQLKEWGQEEDDEENNR